MPCSAYIHLGSLPVVYVLMMKAPARVLTREFVTNYALIMRRSSNRLSKRSYAAIVPSPLREGAEPNQDGRRTRASRRREPVPPLAKKRCNPKRSEQLEQQQVAAAPGAAAAEAPPPEPEQETSRRSPPKRAAAAAQTAAPPAGAPQTGAPADAQQPEQQQQQVAAAPGAATADALPEPVSRRALPACFRREAKAFDNSDKQPAAAARLPVLPKAMRPQPAANSAEQELDPALQALHTPREDLRGPPQLIDGKPFVWAPARMGADAAQAGPNGLVSGCNLQPENVIIGMCSVHVERALQQKKHTYFVVKNDKGELCHPEVRSHIVQ